MTTANLFIAFTAGVALGVVISIARYFPARIKIPALCAFAIWLAYVFALSNSGVLADPTRRPPGIIFFVAPAFVTIAFVTLSKWGRNVAVSIPIALLIGAQSFRIIVELFLHQLWLEGSLPKMMTYSGVNFDIAIGITALVLGGLVARRNVSQWTLKAWNLIGIAMVLNVAIRGVLSVRGPLQLITNDIPNAAVVTFPYTFIPTLMVPLALLLHVLALRNVGATAGKSVSTS